MNDSIDAQLLDYYQRELTWLHRTGATFAQNHQAVAANLRLSAQGSQDPHVERLLEGFALLAARLQRRLDDDYAEFSDALLEQIYPLALRPMPSCAIVAFSPDPLKGQLNNGYTLPRGSQLFAPPQAPRSDSIYWRTSTDVQLWPLSVAEVSLLDRTRASDVTGIPQALSALRLELSGSDKVPLGTLGITHLRIHLAGNPLNRAQLYDLLSAHSLDVCCGVPGEPASVRLNAKPLAVGFADSEQLLPEEDGLHPGLRLLAEYFAFPDKFAFFDLPVRIPPLATDRLVIHVAFDRAPVHRISLQREDIALGCTPVINLFARTAETLRPDGSRSEHRLVADAHREDSVEIHSITSLQASSADALFPVARYYGCQHGQSDVRLFWHARRTVGLNPNRRGTDLLLSLVDPQFEPLSQLPGLSFTAKVLCTNRHLAEELGPNSKLKFELSGPVAAIRLLKSPTAQSLPPLGGASRWRLVAQLNLNHLSLVEGDDALAALKEMLSLHNLRNDSSIEAMIKGIARMDTVRVVDQVGRDAWRGWRNGLEVRIQLNDEAFAGQSRMLFGAVLANFLALYANLNCFVRTCLIHNDEEVMRWQPDSDPGLVL